MDLSSQNDAARLLDMDIKLDRSIADLRSWHPDECGLAMALDVIGPRSSMLILREALLYGTRRFELFVERVGVTEAVASTRLKQLTEAGLLARRPYKEPGSRTRYEYVPTDKGRDLTPVVLALMQWGSKHLQPEGAPLAVVDDTSEQPVRVGFVAQDGTERTRHDLRIRPTEHARRAARAARAARATRASADGTTEVADGGEG
ncbi:helix-turn-helix domain-containing protein [Nocardiopsis sp. YSL2]|uniref:winged helix-turn-helix transcriptional regulator n=1 Tax=Nocardiopsis sp. YSL2 TaxID=2939492 RepID=UPI0026F40AEB|nr:helix-turn-helix domain-containing protein [Nocardiopsis sp. YSL2]